MCVQFVLLNHCGVFLVFVCVNFRHRPALGECLAHLAAAMPVAYLEPHLNEYNAFSVYTTKTPRERASECLSVNMSLGLSLHNTYSTQPVKRGTWCLKHTDNSRILIKALSSDFPT